MLILAASGRSILAFQSLLQFIKIRCNMIRHKIVFALIALVFLLAIDRPAQAQKRVKLERLIESLMADLRAKEAEFLSPSAKDVAAHAEFLRQPDTGIMRLMPREKYDGKLLTRGGGAYYSFARLTNEYGFGSDISLEQDQFGVGFAGANFGFLVKLGDVPIESVSLEHSGVEYLATFVTPTIEPGAREQQRRGHPGFDVGGFTYAHRMVALVDNTYAVRSINYGGSDVLVAFRVVRQDSDGSLVLLWKTLKTFPMPELAR